MDDDEKQGVDEAPLSPPAEWGKERSPVVDKVVAVGGALVGVAVVAGLVFWGFGLLDVDDEDVRGAVRPTAEQDVVATTTTPAPRGANEADVGDCVRIV